MKGFRTSREKKTDHNNGGMSGCGGQKTGTRKKKKYDAKRHTVGLKKKKRGAWPHRRNFPT